MAELHAGQEFAGHRIEEVAGRGGMGVVYVATHLALGRRVALKLIAPDLAEDEGFRERFQRESRVAASIDHPNVIPIHHAGEEDGALYITMRYVEGTDLRQLITEHGGLEPAIAASIISQTGAALDAAHAAGLVHRDVKPANILIDGGAANPHAFLTDFGLTRRTASAGGLTKTGQWVGTLDYVAPEQIEGKDVDARADVYALGCVLFQALTGEVPYPKDSDVAKMWAHMNDEPPSVRERSPTLPHGFEDAVSKSMAKDPDDRYPSAGNLGEAVTAAAGGRAIATPERSVAIGSAAPGGAPASTETAAAQRPPAAAETAASPEPPRPPSKGPNPLLIAGGAVGALALLAAILFLTGILGGGGDSAGDAAATANPEVEAVLADFETGFANEDLSAMEEDALANSADYQYLGNPVESANTEYADIFRLIEITDYQLEVGDVRETGTGSFEADARYSYTDSKGRTESGSPAPFAGSLTFSLVDEEGSLRIEEVGARPDLIATWTVTDPPETTDSTAQLDGEVVSEQSVTFEDEGEEFINLPIAPEVAGNIQSGDKIEVTTEWAGPKQSETETYKLDTPYAS